MAGTDEDALRRRLYAPDATDSDVARYVAIAPPLPDALPEPATAPPRRRHGLALAGAGLIGAALLGVLAATLAGGSVAAPRPSARVTPTPPVDAVLTTATSRDTFVASLDDGDAAGLAPYFLAHPESLPGPLRTTTRADSDEYHGSKDTAITLDPSPAALRGGRLTVVIVAARDTELRWNATAEGDGRLVNVPGAARVLHLTAGVPVSATVRYSGEAPSTLVVIDRADVPWGALVTFTN